MFRQLGTHGDAARPREPLVVAGPASASRRGSRANPCRSGRPRVQLGHVRPHGALRGRERDRAGLLDHRDAAMGERGAGLERRADERARPAPVRDRRPEALQRHVRRTPTACMLPRVRQWIAWNEPNNPVFLKPQSSAQVARGTIRSRRDYARICNAVVAGVKPCRERRRRSPAARRRRAATTTRARSARRSRRSHSSRDEDGRRARVRRVRPPSVLRPPVETPDTPPPPGKRGQPSTAVTLGNFDVLVDRADRALREHADLDHRVRLPDEAARRVLRRHAGEAGCLPERAWTYARRHPADRHVPLVPARDEPRASGWQSGLITFDGKRKSSFNAFRRAALGP